MHLLSVLIATSLMISAQACSCREPRPDMFCRANFGVLVYVEDEGTVSGWERVYQVKLVADYKLGSQDRALLDETHIYTPSQENLCGTGLEKGKYYLLTGHYRQRNGRNIFKVYLCDYQRRFDTNPKDTYTPPACNSDSVKSAQTKMVRDR